MATRKLIGKVIDDAGVPQAGTDVWLSAPGVARAKDTTGDDGSFSLELGDEFLAGSYRLEALPTKDALGEGRNVKLDESGPPAPVELCVTGRGAVSAMLGWAFMLSMIAALAFLTWLYFDLHGFNLKEAGQRDSSSVQKSRMISEDLSNILAIAKAQAGVAAAELAQPGELSDEDRAAAAQKAQGSSMAQDSLTAAEGIFADLKKRRLGTLDPSKVTAVESLFAQARKAAESGDLPGLESSIAHLEAAVVEPEEPFFWSRKPAILLEGLFWALAATLIRLIFNAGYYLYKRTFLATAIPHHIAIAISVPVLAVLISFFLSLVKVSMSVSDVDLVLDMSNVYIVILAAALIGFAPWKAWDFIQQLADLMFEKLGGVFKSEPSES